MTKEEISRRIREGVKAVIEEVLEQEMTEHLAARYRAPHAKPTRRTQRPLHPGPDHAGGQDRTAQDPPGSRGDLPDRGLRARQADDRGGGRGRPGDVSARGFHPQDAPRVTEGLSRIRIGKEAVSWIAQRLEGDRLEGAAPGAGLPLPGGELLQGELGRAGGRLGAVGGGGGERGEPGQLGHGGDTQGHGRLGVQALHGHGPALSPRKRNPQKSRLD